MNQNLQKIISSHFPRDTDGNIVTSPEIIQEYTKAIIQSISDNLYFHGHTEATNQIEYHITNKWGIK